MCVRDLDVRTPGRPPFWLAEPYTSTCLLSVVVPGVQPDGTDQAGNGVDIIHGANWLIVPPSSLTRTRFDHVVPSSFDQWT